MTNSQKESVDKKRWREESYFIERERGKKKGERERGKKKGERERGKKKGEREREKKERGKKKENVIQVLLK